MDNNTLQKVKDILGRSQNFAIAVGPNPSMDEMAAALSLYLSFRGANKNATVVSPTEPTVAISSLVGIDKVQTSLGGGGATGDLVVAFPYRDGEIEKVSYTIDGGFLNIVVKAGEQGLTFDEQDVKFKRGGAGASEVLITVGVSQLSDLGALVNPESIQNTMVINIDNKNDNQGYGDVVLVSPRFSSVSEQVADILTALTIDFDVDAAQNLLTGIASATDNFQDPRTSYLAFEMVALLMRKGATRERIAQASQPQISRAERQVRDRLSTFMQQPTTPPVQQQSSFTYSQQQPPIQRPQPMQRPQPQQQVQRRQQDTQNAQDAQSAQAEPQDQAPADWLAPKVYKGSTSV